MKIAWDVFCFGVAVGLILAILMALAFKAHGG